jgi:hypothetical protein
MEDLIMNGKLILGAAMMLVILLSACTPSIESGARQGLPGSNTDAEIKDVDDPGSLRVLWTVSGYVPGVGFAGDEASAQARLFDPLDIDEDQITFGGKKCVGVTFQEKTVDAADYLANTWQEKPENLGIEEFDELQVIQTNCKLFGFQEYIRLDDARLLVPYEGIFYFFEPFEVY